MQTFPSPPKTNAVGVVYSIVVHLGAMLAEAVDREARVFVSRVEVLSTWTQQLIESAQTMGDVPTTKFGRFLDPFVDQIRNGSSGFVLPPAAEQYLRQAHVKIQNELHESR